MVTHFHHSIKSTNILRQKQKDLRYSEECLVQDVSTRWNSCYYMMERILKQQQPICATLLEAQKQDLMPTDGEVTAMETFIDVLKPFVQITEMIGGEQWVTLSVVKPLLFKLTKKHLVEERTDTRLKKALKKAILSDLKNRYTDSQLIDIACFLDPRFKLSFVPDTDRKKVMAIIEKEAAREVLVPVDPDSGGEELPEKRQKKENVGLLSLLEDVCEPEAIIDQSTGAKREIEKYLCMSTCTDKNPLDWWKMYESELSLFAKLAKKYLCIPATSVPSERAFSTAGHVVNAKRACLLPENVNILVFLAHNLQ